MTVSENFALEYMEINGGLRGVVQLINPELSPVRWQAVVSAKRLAGLWFEAEDLIIRSFPDLTEDQLTIRAEKR